MDNRIYAIFIILTLDLLAIWLLWSKIFVKHLKIEMGALQKITVRYFGMPMLAGIAILLLISLLNTFIADPRTVQFFKHLFRFAMITIVFSAGVYELLHALFVWPQGNENIKKSHFYFLLAILPALIFIALGILLLVKFFQFS